MLLFSLGVPTESIVAGRFVAETDWGDALGQLGEIEVLGRHDPTDTDGDGLPDALPPSPPGEDEPVPATPD